MAAPTVEPILEMETNAVGYTQMAHLWPSTIQVIRISVQGFNGDAFEIPQTFLQTSGDNSWRLVLAMLHAIIKEPGRLVLPLPPGSTAANVERQPVDMSGPPEAGEYDYVPETSAFTWRKGPEGPRKGRAFVESDSYEIYSDSDVPPATEQSDDFRLELVVRDGYCIVSDRNVHSCRAAHIVPKTRSDIYRLLLGTPTGPHYRAADLYQRSMGILLSSELHQLYDCYEWSLYYLDGDYFVHIFRPDGFLPQEIVQYHGKRIAPERFMHMVPSEERPDPVLCNWHWQQCCMKHFRGFSAGMSVNAY